MMDSFLYRSIKKYLETGILPAVFPSSKGNFINTALKYEINGQGNLTRDALLVVEAKDAATIFATFHTHSGRTKCWDKIKARYYWYGGEKYVREKTKECVVCWQKRGHNNAKIAPLCPIEVQPQIMWRVHVDLAGPFPKSKQESKYLAIGICAFSKYIEAMRNIFFQFLSF